MRLVFFLIPILLSYFVYESDPILAYSLVWLNSVALTASLTLGWLDPRLSRRYNFTYPFLPHVIPYTIFTTYMSITSIFYFLSINGYIYFDRDYSIYPNWHEIQYCTQAQQYYCLGHWSLTAGILLFSSPISKPDYIHYIKDIPSFAFKTTLFANGIALIFRFIPGFSQINVILTSLASVSTVICLAYSIIQFNLTILLTSLAIFVLNFYQALISGWKESIIIPLILLGTYLYPYHRKKITLLAPIVLGFYFYIIPSINQIIRNLAWSGTTSGEEALKIAYESLKSDNLDISETNWKFLTERLSEISMFIKYIQSCPDYVDFHKAEIVKQALESIIPRIFYPSKPITESLVMQRVLQHGVVQEYSNVSAKPQLVVDGYLSAGWIGVFLSMFILGVLMSWIAQKSWHLFGGYEIGIGLMYTGLFTVFWRGNCMEFMSNSIFWGTVILFVMHRLALYLGILIPNPSK